jgi:hypothetical protein
MIERDEELAKLLRKWESPAPGPDLDARVWKSFRQSAVSQRWRWTRKWLPIAAAVLLVAGSAKLWLAAPVGVELHGVTIETTADADGFRPVSNGTITVVKEERRQ